MANKILIIGDSGSGKSTSLRTLNPETTFLVNTIGKTLPFKGWTKKYRLYDKATKKGNMIKTHNAMEIIAGLQYISDTMPHVKTIIVDDSQYVMSYEYMERAKETGFQKFTEIADNMFRIFKKPDELRDDLTVVFLGHTEEVSSNGQTKTKIKTIGKMLDEKITVEGMFTIVLLAYSYKDSDKSMKYVFVTQSNGTNTCKSPMDMFKETLIPNDLKMVLDRVEEYNNEE